MLKKLGVLLMLSGVAFGLAACNTVAGMGADVKAAGNAVEKAADESKPK